MRVCVAYIYPMVNLRTYFPLALRFSETYQEFPPGFDHELHVICNGRTPTDNEIRMFNGIPAKIGFHDNSGWDIGAFQSFAESNQCDLMVCLGAHAHFYRPNWLKAMVDAFVNWGPGLYGCACYSSPRDHVRTTLFWCPPEIIRSYPYTVGSSRSSRYEFEHGKNSITRHVQKHGLPCMMVTWKGCFPFERWHDNAPDRNEVLVRDQHLHAPDSRW